MRLSTRQEQEATRTEAMILLLMFAILTLCSVWTPACADILG